MRNPGNARWLDLASLLLRRDHRAEIVGDLIEERRLRMFQGRSRVSTALWTLGHVFRSAVAGRQPGGPLVPGPRSTRAGGVFWLDVRYALRRLVARPAASLIAIATLTAGIGVSAGVFGIVNALLFKTPPVRDIDRVVTVHPANRTPAAYNDVEFSEFEQLRDLTGDLIDTISAVGSWGGAVSGPDATEYLGGDLVSADYFRTLGLTPRAGTFALFGSDHSPRPAVVISDRLWQTWFQRSHDVVGRTIKVSGDTLTVVGVAPDGFGGVLMPTTRRADLWMPFDVSARIDPYRHTPSPPGVRLLARLRDDRTVDASRSAIASVGERVPLNPRRRSMAAADGESASDPFTGPARLTISLLRKSLVPADLAAVAATAGGGFTALAALVLLIACSNLANVLLADVLGRRSEFAIRLSSGASRAHLVRLIATETVILTGIALAGGLMLAVGISRGLASLPLPVMYLKIDPSPDWRVVAFGTALGLVAAVGIAAGPAWRAARSSPAALLPHSGNGPRSRKLRSVLVAAQMAACTVLLVVSGLYVRSAIETLRHNPGFDPTHTAMVRVDLDASGIDEAHGRPFLMRALAEASALPAVRRAMLADALPLGNALQKASLVGDGGTRGHRPQTLGQFARVSAGFLESMRIPVIAGRTFTSADVEASARVALVNERTAAALWPAGDAMGHRVALFGEVTGWREIVGIVKDTDVRVAGQAGAVAFVPFDQEYAGRVSIVVETDGPPEALVAPLRAIVRQLDPDVVTTASSTVAADQAGATLPIRLAAVVLAGLGALALAISTLGLYGVVAYTVRLRTREIGVRVALGATAARVQQMVLRQSSMMLLGGVIPGLLLAFIAVGWLRAWLFGIGEHDPVTFITVPVLLVAVGLIATLRPARHAARIDPTVALREL